LFGRGAWLWTLLEGTVGLMGLMALKEALPNRGAFIAALCGQTASRVLSDRQSVWK